MVLLVLPPLDHLGSGEIAVNSCTILSDAAMTNISAERLLSHAVRSLRCNFDARGHKFAKPRSDRIVVEFRALKSPISGSTIGLGGKIMGFSFAAKLRP